MLCVNVRARVYVCVHVRVHMCVSALLCVHVSALLCTHAHMFFVPVSGNGTQSLLHTSGKHSVTPSLTCPSLFPAPLYSHCLTQFLVTSYLN